MISYHEAAEAAPAKIDYHRLIGCLEQVEGGSNEKPGGALCWTKAAWREESGLPYSFCQQPAASHLFAYKRLIRLASKLREADIAVTPFTLAMLWHHGLTGTIRILEAGEGSDYGIRAAALYSCK